MSLIHQYILYNRRFQIKQFQTYSSNKDDFAQEGHLPDPIKALLGICQVTENKSGLRQNFTLMFLLGELPERLAPIISAVYMLKIFRLLWVKNKPGPIFVA